MSIIRFQGAWLALLALLAPRALPAQGSGLERNERIRALVLSTNAELAALRSHTAWAEARSRAAGFAPAATLSAELEEVPDGLALTRAGSARIELSREFRPAGSRASERRLADVDVTRSRVRTDATERRLRAQTTAFVIHVLGSAMISARLAAEDSLLAGAEEALRSRFAIGEARYVDVLRLRTERLRVRSEMAIAFADESIARDRLLSLAADTAIPVIQGLLDSLRADSAALVLESPPMFDAESLAIGSALVQLATLDVTAAEASRSLVRSAGNPIVTAALGAQRFGESGQGFQVGPVLAASVTLPFTNRGLRPSQEAAEAGLVAARANELLARSLTLSNVRAADARYRSALARARFVDAALLRGARDERETALAAYRAGTLTLLELLDFERALSRAESDRVRSQIEAAAALADLFVSLAATSDDPSATARPPRLER